MTSLGVWAWRVSAVAAIHGRSPSAQITSWDIPRRLLWPSLDVTGRLIDKLALLRLTFSSDAADWVDRIHRGLVWIRTVIRLETGCSARSTSRSAHLIS